MPWPNFLEHPPLPPFDERWGMSDMLSTAGAGENPNLSVVSQLLW